MRYLLFGIGMAGLLIFTWSFISHILFEVNISKQGRVPHLPQPSGRVYYLWIIGKVRNQRKGDIIIAKSQNQSYIYYICTSKNERIILNEGQIACLEKVYEFKIFIG